MKSGARVRAATARDRLAVVDPAQVDHDKVRFPDLADLLARLRFSTSDGRIWLDDQRMLLVHAKSLGALRREMIEVLGIDVARGFLTRMGYRARVVRKPLFPRPRGVYGQHHGFGSGQIRPLVPSLLF